jgi:hypothetical protein
MSANANYNGKQSNNTSYIKNYIRGNAFDLWSVLNNSTKWLIPASSTIDNVFIPGNLHVVGSITNPSDIQLKQNVITIDLEQSNKLLLLKPSSFTFKADKTDSVHYGFIAQDVETVFPEIVQDIQQYKSISYLELLPLLVHKMQNMQQEIDILKEQAKTLNEQAK